MSLSRASALTLCAVLLTSQLLACSGAPSVGSAQAPGVAAASGYASALPGVLAGGDPRSLEQWATEDQIDRVARYQLLLKGEQSRLLASELTGWQLVSVGDEDGAMLVVAKETWLMQPVDAETGAAVEPPERRVSLVEYRVVYQDGVWRVANLEERP